MPGLTRPHPIKKDSFSNVTLYAKNEDDASIPPFTLRKRSSRTPEISLPQKNFTKIVYQLQEEILINHGATKWF